MIRILASTLAVICLALASGCASTANTANQGANQAGQAVGSVMRLPSSLGDGIIQGAAGQPSPNPYNR